MGTYKFSTIIVAALNIKPIGLLGYALKPNEAHRE